jgi:hypothetical protein
MTKIYTPPLWRSISFTAKRPDVVQKTVMDETLCEIVSSLYQKGDAVAMFRAMLSAAPAARI